MIYHPRQLQQERKKYSETNLRIQQPTALVPPITIVRQGGSKARFAIQNSTWFAVESGSEDIVVDGNAVRANPPRPQHIFAIFATGVHGSRDCIVLENLLAVDVSFSSMMDAHCSNTGSIAVVRAYAQFDNADIKKRGLEDPECCVDPCVNSSLPSSYTVTEHKFQLQYISKCDDPGEHFETRSIHSDSKVVKQTATQADKQRSFYGGFEDGLPVIDEDSSLTWELAFDSFSDSDSGSEFGSNFEGFVDIDTVERLVVVPAKSEINDYGGCFAFIAFTLVLLAAMVVVIRCVDDD